MAHRVRMKGFSAPTVSQACGEYYLGIFLGHQTTSNGFKSGLHRSMRFSFEFSRVWSSGCIPQSPGAWIYIELPPTLGFRV